MNRLTGAMCVLLGLMLLALLVVGYYDTGGAR